MGFARILSGGPDGRYTIALDWGKATKTAVLSALSVYLTQVEVQLGQTQAKVSEVLSDLAEVAGQIETEIISITERQSTLPPGSPGLLDLDKLLKFFLEKRAGLQRKLDPLQSQLTAQKFEKARVLRDIAYWTAFDAEETRQAWCVDLTEDKAAGSYVATLDIPGDSSLIVLAPGCRAPTNADGQLVAREMTSPAGAFFNAAVAPGWAKWKPTARWGTITGINYEANTADVALAPATVSQQRLDVNQTTALAGVPVVYMTCNARAFEIGDRVVVQFVGQSWSSPRVVGFLDNPRPCVELPDIIVPIDYVATITTPASFRKWTMYQFVSECGDSGVVFPSVQASGIWSDSLSFTTNAATFDGTPPPPRHGGAATINYTPPGPLLIGTNSFRGIPNTVQVPGGSSPGIRIEPVDVPGFSFAIGRWTYPFADVTTREYTTEVNPSPPPSIICIPDPDETAPYFSLQPWGADQFAKGENANTFDYLHGPMQIQTFLTANAAMPAVSVSYDGEVYEYEFVGTSIGVGRYNLRYRQVR